MSRWNTVAIFGVGLIGGSIGMAVRQRGLAELVVGLGRNAERLSKAVELGAISSFVTNPAKLPSPDLVVLCAPVQRLPEHCQEICDLHPNALITDVGSTKQRLVSQIEAERPQARFVGSHPLAGSDRSGVENADAELFRGRVVILTPSQQTDPSALGAIEEFWETLGAEPLVMSPEQHDRLLAVTSHLPHIVAAALAAETPTESLQLVAGGWRDTTRIAASDVELWTQIFLENSTNVLAALSSIQSRLREFEAALDGSDRESLMRLLAAGKQQRDALGS